MQSAQFSPVHLSAHTSLAVINTKIALYSLADTCVVGNHYLIVHDHNRPVNIYACIPKAGSKHACVVDATVTYAEPDTGQFAIFFINQAIEMKGLGHHLLCLMQCLMNGVLINKVTKFLAPILSEIMHAMQIENPFDDTHPIIITLKLNEDTSYFKVRTPTQQEYEDQKILEVELMATVPP